jgi:RHS repeat-associated protein
VEWNAGSTNQEWYLYDASGTRVLRRSTNGSSTTLTTYPFGLQEHLYSGSGTNQSNTYYYFLGGTLIGDLNANGTFFLLTDALGSVLSDISWAAGGASIKANQVFGPYGNARANQGTFNTAKGFTGQYNDGLTGLDYYVSRYYDPVVGVFLSADKTQGNLQGLDPYTYVGGNPETHNDPTGEAYINNGGGSYVPPPPPPNPCTFGSCTVTLSNHQTYRLSDLLNRNERRNFLAAFYNQFAAGYGTAELAFFDFLNKSGRLAGSKYWDSVDYDLARDELVAAFDFLNHHSAQSTVVSAWLTFMAHPTNDSWWSAHNGSINAGDQEARASGLYRKESLAEQGFINETIHVINDIQFASQGNGNPLNYAFSPEAPTTGTLSSLFYPQQYNDTSDVDSFMLQGKVAIGAGAVAGAVLGAVVGGEPGAIAGTVVGAAAGVGTFLSLLL